MDPESGAEYLLGASAQLSSEGAQKKVGSISQELQTPCAEEDELVEVGDGRPPLFLGSECGLIVDGDHDATPLDLVPEKPKAENDAADLEGVDLSGSVRERCDESVWAHAPWPEDGVPVDENGPEPVLRLARRLRVEDEKRVFPWFEGFEPRWRGGLHEPEQPLDVKLCLERAAEALGGDLVEAVGASPWD